MVFDSGTGRLLADLDSPGATLVVAAGGRGGWGNTHFATPVAQTPRHRELGDPGAVAVVRLELRLIADLGLVGLPNAGKSSLLARLTGARPKVADYPFTTLTPNLGVAELEGGRTITVADVPGLIEGAHLGAGLGIGFLRHLQRTRSLVQVVDASSGPEAAVQAYSEVHRELRAWDEELAARPRVVAANKVDLMVGRDRARVVKALREAAGAASAVLQVSALTGEGLDGLLQESLGLARGREPLDPGGFRLYPGPRPTRQEVVVEGGAGRYRVVGERVLRLVAAADLDDPEEVTRLQRQLRRLGVESQLSASGASEGDVVEIGDVEFTFIPESPAR
jgi:GTP-binding protein